MVRTGKLVPLDKQTVVLIIVYSIASKEYG